MKKIALIASGLLAVPFISSAQELGNFKTLVASVGQIVNMIIPIVFAVAVLVFFWGLVQYLLGAEHDQDKAKKTMLWGVVALFVMAAVWGLVAFLGNALGIDDRVAPTVNRLIPKP